MSIISNNEINNFITTLDIEEFNKRLDEVMRKLSLTIYYNKFRSKYPRKTVEHFNLSIFLLGVIANGHGVKTKRIAALAFIILNTDVEVSDLDKEEVDRRSVANTIRTLINRSVNSKSELLPIYLDAVKLSIIFSDIKIVDKVLYFKYSDYIIKNNFMKKIYLKYDYPEKVKRLKNF